MISYVPYYLKEIHASDILRESGAVTAMQWGGGGNIVRRAVTNIKLSEIQKGCVNTLRTGLLNCLNTRSQGLTFRHHASCI